MSLIPGRLSPAERKIRWENLRAETCRHAVYVVLDGPGVSVHLGTLYLSPLFSFLYHTFSQFPFLHFFLSFPDAFLIIYNKERGYLSLISASMYTTGGLQQFGHTVKNAKQPASVRLRAISYQNLVT